MPKIRADQLLLARGLVESRAKAQAIILAGQARANGETISKPSSMVDEAAQVEVIAGPRYVSRGGEKLEGALTAFGLAVQSFICADVGASTGGFTDCLLQHGAARVYAIDVGKGILDWRLRTDPRVVVLEETNARYLESLPEPVDLVTIDASFISLKVLLPVVKHWLKPETGALLMLIKPQFEAGKREVARGKGVIRDPEVHRRVVEEVLTAAAEVGLYPHQLTRSPILGPKGNAEFLVYLIPNRLMPPLDFSSILAPYDS
ncbi:MAG: TlyA family rRNA (cytidine-2'-O)-methyltransferase [Anaerolineales bacterium]